MRTVASLTNLSVLGIVTLVVDGFHNVVGYHFAYVHHIFDPSVTTIQQVSRIIQIVGVVGVETCSVGVRLCRGFEPSNIDPSESLTNVATRRWAHQVIIFDLIVGLISGELGSIVHISTSSSVGES